MAEAGGPTTQAGIYYQNTVAALYLGRMLDPIARASGDRVLRVRVEAPQNVDDIVAHMGDGARRFIQAKLSLTLGSDPWSRLWHNFSDQLLRLGTTDEDRLLLVLGESSELASGLRACCERCVGTDNNDEYLERLTAPQRRIVSSILGVLSSEGRDLAFLRRLLEKTDVEVMPDNILERDYAPLWMPVASALPNRLLVLLRDLAGGGARFRASFEPAELRNRLRDLHSVDISEPNSWGAGHYRAVITGRAVIEIPGTWIVKPIDETFPWPRATRYERTGQTDFDDETPSFVYGIRPDEVDVSLFPSPELHHVVVIAGPGFGKSVLTTALAAKRAAQGRLPVVVSIPELSRLDVTIWEYLDDHINSTFQVAIDWLRAAETGLLILLLDGLDEVATIRRTVILERIKTFALRHPTTPWLLTVRDAAALAAPTDARLLELEPLDDTDIDSHVSFYRPEDPDFRRGLKRQLEARPDLLRLARIPLFLALLAATQNDPDELPASRRALLETYLELLFRPEQFKLGEVDNVDPTILRPIAEVVAFEALEREEIGVSARLLETTIRGFTPNGPTSIIERLVKCGVMRRSSPGRYVFPFPIVQEYLAACHLSATRLNEVFDRFGSAIKRPWAQTLQFVLEQHPAPAEIARRLLTYDDDAFNTNLRLVARCVANGMQIDASTRQEIARRLAAIWPRSTWRTGTRIGQLIGEAFSTPLIDEIRDQLSDRNLLHSGAGSIVARINDASLTTSVLANLLRGDIEHLFNIAELQQPVNDLGDKALALYIERLRASNTKEEVDALSCLIGNLDGKNISQDARLAVALDHETPLTVRLAAFSLGPNPIDDRALPLIDSAVGTDARSAAMCVIAKTTNPAQTLRTILLREEIPLAVRKDLLDRYSSALPAPLLPSTVKNLANDSAIQEELRQRLLVFSARHGDLAAMESLVARLGDLPLEIVGATISLLGHHRSKPLVQTIVDRLSSRQLTPQDRVMLASSAATGTTSIFEMDFFRGGALQPAPPHPGLDLLRHLIEQWEALNDYSSLDALRMSEDLVRMGSEKTIDQLPARIASVVNGTNVDLDDCTNAAIIGSAIQTLQERRIFLPLSFLESVISRCSYNAASRAALMIAALGNREAFDSLLKIHAAGEDHHLRQTALDAIETLAGRLGLRVCAVQGRLEAAVN